MPDPTPTLQIRLTYPEPDRALAEEVATWAQVLLPPQVRTKLPEIEAWFTAARDAHRPLARSAYEHSCLSGDGSAPPRSSLDHCLRPEFLDEARVAVVSSWEQPPWESWGLRSSSIRIGEMYLNDFGVVREGHATPDAIFEMVMHRATELIVGPRAAFLNRIADYTSEGQNGTSIEGAIRHLRLSFEASLARSNRFPQRFDAVDELYQKLLGAHVMVRDGKYFGENLDPQT